MVEMESDGEKEREEREKVMKYRLFDRRSSTRSSQVVTDAKLNFLPFFKVTTC